MIEIIPVDTPSLGDRGYLVTDGGAGTVVDPQRDIDRYLALAVARGVTITHAFGTHLHNDYLTGRLALARVTGTAYHVSAADQVAFDREPVRDGDLVAVGPSARIRALATPGHTFTHLSYLLAGLDAYPAYYARMGPANAAGPIRARPAPARPGGAGRIAAADQGRGMGRRPALPPGLRRRPPPRLAGLRVRRLLHQSPRLAAATRPAPHPDRGEPGAGRRGAAGPVPDRCRPPRRRGPGLGRPRPAGQFPGHGLRRARRRAAQRPVVVLDVRRDLEWAAGHLAGARHIPLHELPARISEVPAGEVWVHCQGGYRACVAASLLQAAGREVTAIDDEFSHAAAAGLAVVG